MCSATALLAAVLVSCASPSAGSAWPARSAPSAPRAAPARCALRGISGSGTRTSSRYLSSTTSPTGAGFGQLHAMTGVVRVDAGTAKRGAPGSPTKNGAIARCSSSTSPASRKSWRAAPAFEQDLSDGPFSQIIQNQCGRRRFAGVDHLSQRGQPRPGHAEPSLGAIDQPGRGAHREERRRRRQVAGRGHSDLDRVLRQASGHAGGPARFRADDQPGVVAPDGGGADHDRVAAGPHLIHPVQILVTGQDEPVTAPVVDVAVH